MRRRTFVAGLAGIAAAPLFLGEWLGLERDPDEGAGRGAGPGLLRDAAAGGRSDTTGGEAVPPLRKSREEWKRILEPDAYAVLFEAYTERPFSSPLDHETRAGTYVCAACFLPLFSSDTKYDSGTGWPSFWRPLDERHLATKPDYQLVVPRTEYHCVRCGGHQGHVFDDGPPPTGLRYCNNGLALRFVPKGEDLPALRT